MKRLVLALAVMAAATPARAQLITSAPAPKPSPSPAWTASLYTGGVGVITAGQHKDYVTARLELSGPLGDSVSAFLRADAWGTQDAGSLSTSLQRTFRDVEANGGVAYRMGAVDLLAAGGVTFSIEGQTGAPIDPRMYSGAVLVRAPLAAGGYVGGGGGWYGPVGGWAALATGSVPIKAGAFVTFDYALPLQTDALGRRSYLMRVGSTVRIGSLQLGKVFGR